MKTRPRGFTLIELLVVIAIIAVLIAPLTRPPSSRLKVARPGHGGLQCVNNLKQITLAAHNFIAANNALPYGERIVWAFGLTSSTAGDYTVSDMTTPFGPNWAVMLLPYLEQQTLFNASNVLGYPGIPGYPQNDSGAPGPAGPWTSPDGHVIPNQSQYNMDWANSTLHGTTLNVFVCPTDAYNNSGNKFMSGSDVAFGFTPTDPRTGTPLLNWARGSYGAVQGGTDTDHTVNDQTGSSSAPFKNVPKHGVMGVNFGSSIAQVTDGTSNTLFFAEMRSGLATMDGRGVWAMGFAGSSLCCETRPYNPTPNAQNWAGTSCDDGGDETQTCFALAQSMPGYAKMGMPCNCTQGNNNSGGQARSLHPGGVNVGLGDGSVRFIKNTISNQLWFYLIVRDDTNIISADQY